jgi:hypothetical protein
MAVVRVPNSTSFKPGHKGKGGIGARGQIRRDLTLELISQLNETLKDKNGVERTKLHRVVIDQATIGADEHDENGGLKKEGHGIFAAIMAVWERLEGRVGVRSEEEEEGQEKAEYRTIEDVAMFLLERGIDALSVPPPPLRIVNEKKE